MSFSSSSQKIPVAKQNDYSPFKSSLSLCLKATIESRLQISIGSSLKQAGHWNQKDSFAASVLTLGMRNVVLFLLVPKFWLTLPPWHEKFGMLVPCKHLKIRRSALNFFWFNNVIFFLSNQVSRPRWPLTAYNIQRMT